LFLISLFFPITGPKVMASQHWARIGKELQVGLSIRKSLSMLILSL
jgi:hypothetical protein